MSATATKVKYASRGERVTTRRGVSPKKKKGKYRRTPARNAKRKLGRGDWLVQQVKSKIGISPQQYETLVELGLCKIGRSGLFYGDQPAAWGQIRRVQHLVSVRALVRPSEPHFLYPEVTVSKPEAVPYDVGGREARHYDFDGDSFMSVEPYKGSFAINWSTALPIATVLERMDPALLDAVRDCVVFDPAGPGRRNVEVEDVLPDLRSGSTSYPFVRFESEDLVFVWQRPAYPSHVDEDVGAGRIGLVCHEFDAEALGQMMRDTATPPLGECIEELMEDVAVISGKSL
jgi:ribosomal protein L30/L7E